MQDIPIVSEYTVKTYEKENCVDIAQNLPLAVLLFYLATLTLRWLDSANIPV